MKKTVAVFAVIICSFFTWMVRAEAKGALPAAAAVLLEMEGQSYYLAHNLHGDREQRKVYSANYQLYPNESNAEGANSGWIDLVSNGFKITTGNAGINDSGATFIYAAFAEFPIVSSNDVPGVAR